MENLQITEVTKSKAETSVLTNERGLLLRELYSLPGRDILNRILDTDNPRALIQQLPFEDFFWLFKKVGEEDSVALLELASAGQWQYLLDLELWKRDRLDVSHTSHWLSLLQKADIRQLVKWLLGEGEYLAYYHFFRTIEVVVANNKDEVLDLSEGFFSLDGVFHIRVIDPEYRENMENIIRVMADEDYSRYQALFLRISGVVPAEVEEEMYRQRNVRLAEHGFLPYEEAIAVYSPLDAAILKTEGTRLLPNVILDEETRALVPVIPFSQTGTQNLFMDVVSGIRDPIFLDRIRLQFAGLANQILSADGLMVHEIEVLVEACKRTARIVNLAVERTCARDLLSAERLLRHHSLLTLFRVGFGMALKIKWEAERWLKESWFYRQGLDPGFWGEYRGGILKGLLAKRPRYYVGSSEREEYRDFEWLSDLSDCLEVIRGLMVLDGLMEKLIGFYPIKEEILHSPQITCYPLLFTLWSRLFLKLEPSFSRLSMRQAKGFLSKLRGRSRKPPYRIGRFKKTFIRDLMAYVSDSDPGAASILDNTLSRIWEEFREEYANVSIIDLDGRYSRLLLIDTSPSS